MNNVSERYNLSSDEHQFIKKFHAEKKYKLLHRACGVFHRVEGFAFIDLSRLHLRTVLSENSSICHKIIFLIFLLEFLSRFHPMEFLLCCYWGFPQKHLNITSLFHSCLNFASGRTLGIFMIEL